MFSIPKKDQKRALGQRLELTRSSCPSAAVVGEADAHRYWRPADQHRTRHRRVETSGHLTEEKWRCTAEELISTLVHMVAGSRPADSGP
jgi:hypothetical protein